MFSMGKTSVVILCHSVIRCLHDFLKHGDIRYSAHLGLGKTHSVLYMDVGRKKVHEIISKDIKSVFALGTDVVLMIGKNEIVKSHATIVLASCLRFCFCFLSWRFFHRFYLLRNILFKFVPELPYPFCCERNLCLPNLWLRYQLIIKIRSPTCFCIRSPPVSFAHVCVSSLFHSFITVQLYLDLS